jgi:hypothetical protein
MSSATSIKGKMAARPKQEPAPQPLAERDDSFRPWHFFVLLSLAASTLAVVLARESSPESLVMLSFTIGAAGLAAGALYRALAPLITGDVSVFSEPLTERLRATLEREKTLVLRAIKELEFDRAMGKVSPRDFEEMSGKLRARAIMLIQKLDDGSSGYRELIERELSARVAGTLAPDPRARAATPLEAPPSAAGTDEVSATAVEATAAAVGACRACGSANDFDAAFCKRCGAKLDEPSITAGRRR